MIPSWNELGIQGIIDLARIWRLGFLYVFMGGCFFSIKRFGRLFSSFLDELGFSWGLIDIFSIYWDGQVDLDKQVYGPLVIL